MSFLAAAVVGGGSLLTGGIQAIAGASKAKHAENAIEALQSPTYTPTGSLADYYSKALSRYSGNPYSSQYYNYATNQADRSLASGLSALRGRNTVSGVSRLVALRNDAAMRAGINAENIQGQQLAQLGNAANAMEGQNRFGFQINKLMPYQQKLQLLGMKGAAGANLENAGFQNMFGGINSAAMIGLDATMNKTPKTVGE